MSSNQSALISAVQRGDNYAVKTIANDLKYSGNINALQIAYTKAVYINKAPGKKGQWSDIISILDEIINA